jgi:hypothetical protein
MGEAGAHLTKLNAHLTQVSEAEGGSKSKVEHAQTRCTRHLGGKLHVNHQTAAASLLPHIVAKNVSCGHSNWNYSRKGFLRNSST